MAHVVSTSAPPIPGQRPRCRCGAFVDRFCGNCGTPLDKTEQKMLRLIGKIERAVLLGWLDPLSAETVKALIDEVR